MRVSYIILYLTKLLNKNIIYVRNLENEKSVKENWMEKGIIVVIWRKMSCLGIVVKSKLQKLLVTGNAWTSGQSSC